MADKLRSHYNLKSLSVHRLGPGRKSFGGSVVRLESDVAEAFPTADAVNEALRDDPALANNDPTGRGWFFKIKASDAGEFDQLLEGPAYDALVKNA